MDNSWKYRARPWRGRQSAPCESIYWRRLVVLWVLFVVAAVARPALALAAPIDSETQRFIDGGLRWLAEEQSRLGHWTAREGRYPVAMTALAGMAFLSDGSTTTQGRYAAQVRRAVDYLTHPSRARPNGLIGDPERDDRYTYGHGYSMLFLSQVLGEEEDEDRRQELIGVLTRAVLFTGQAQTRTGGWGYVSALDNADFDEGSTTVTQVQGLRACRNAGIPVPKEVIDRAVAYVRECTGQDGGVRYQFRSQDNRGRPAITAAAVACLFNAGEYDDEKVPLMLDFCEKHLAQIDNRGFGHWHYGHLYYSQVMYREGGAKWRQYRDQVGRQIMQEATRVERGGQEQYYWGGHYIGDVYTTALNLTMLQLEKASLPIYQR